MCRPVLVTELFMCSSTLRKIKGVLKIWGIGARVTVNEWGMVLLSRKYEGNAPLARGSDPRAGNVRRGLALSSRPFLYLCEWFHPPPCQHLPLLWASPTPGAVSPPERSQLEAERSGEGRGRKEDSFLLHSILVSSQNESTSGGQGPCACCLSLLRPCVCSTLNAPTKPRRFSSVRSLRTLSITEPVLSRYCLLANGNILWGHFISKSACMIP